MEGVRDVQDDDTDVVMEMVFPPEHLAPKGWAWRDKNMRMNVSIKVTDMPEENMMEGGGTIPVLLMKRENTEG